MMPNEVAQAAMELLVANAKKTNQAGIDISFHGGGEPTLNWTILKNVIEKGQERCAQKNLKLTSSICTNGTLNEQKTAWLAEHMSSIVISFDGPPAVQNVQRPLQNGSPSFDRVARTVDQLRSLNKPFVFRMTATETMQDRLCDSYAFLAERFQPRAICVEPLFVCGRCANTDIVRPDPKVFIDQLEKIIKLAPQIGVRMTYSGGRLNYLSDHFCGAAGENFFVSPRGEVTSCVEISDYDDPRSRQFIYGAYNFAKHQFEFDLERFANLEKFCVSSKPECSDCFAKWHCAGDCPAKQNGSTPFSDDYRCRINQSILKKQLFLLADRV
jgi:uncharacterized protein